MEEEKKVTNVIRFWVSSWMFKDKERGIEVIGIKEKVAKEYEDGTTKYIDHLQYYNDPSRPFWITLPQFRNHEYKKEFEDIDKLEEFRCRDSELEDRLELALGYRPGFRKRTLKQLCSSPYVYGADIDIQTLIKQKYVDKTPIGKVAKYTRGALDIESEIRGEKRINVISYIHEDQVYTAALREYCKIEKEDGTYKEATEEDCKQVIDKIVGNYITQYNFNIHFVIKDTELELITWIFDRIHENKTDYIGVWNLGFDLPQIIDRLEKLGVNPAKIMCHPSVPDDIKFVNWIQDNSDVQHFTDKWHWIYIAGYTQFLDSMCLYARLRKVYGRDSSYSLDDIAAKELGLTKIHFGAINNHYYMQNHRFLEYIAYNINDVLLVQLMENKNNDMTALVGLSGMSTIEQFSRQTVMVRNDAYHYGRQHGKVLASAGTNMFNDFDKMMPKAGGAVLPPNKAVGVGVNIIKEFDRQTQVCLYTDDLDFSSMYPSTMSAFNISKETQLATILKVNGYSQDAVEYLCSNTIQPDINCVAVCNYFFDLPNFKEMKELYKDYLNQENHSS